MRHVRSMILLVLLYAHTTITRRRTLRSKISIVWSLFFFLEPELRREMSGWLRLACMKVGGRVCTSFCDIDGCGNFRNLECASAGDIHLGSTGLVAFPQLRLTRKQRNSASESRSLGTVTTSIRVYQYTLKHNVASTDRPPILACAT